MIFLLSLLFAVALGYFVYVDRKLSRQMLNEALIDSQAGGSPRLETSVSKGRAVTMTLFSQTLRRRGWPSEDQRATRKNSLMDPLSTGDAIAGYWAASQRTVWTDWHQTHRRRTTEANARRAKESWRN